MSSAVARSFLDATPIVDHEEPRVRALALELAQGRRSALEVAQACFEWVRAEIEHSGDYQRESVTCSASEVLAARTGFCYAKSHLLAALLRANEIPCGFVYQRLANGDAEFCLHGLNALWLPEFGWYRVDARGERPDLLETACEPPRQKLAYLANGPGERLFPGVWAEPVEVVVRALKASRSARELLCNLPDAVELSDTGCVAATIEPASAPRA
jgi:transglutaminase-like putative cysteine protease